MQSHTIPAIATHPDDETIGRGGTMTKIAQEGKSVHVAFIADGVGAKTTKDLPDSQTLAVRWLTATDACTVLGDQNPRFGDYQDNSLDTILLLNPVQYKAIITTYCPDTVPTRHCGELNVDHQMVHKAVVTACRPQTGHPVNTMLFFETPPNTEWQSQEAAPTFTPNWLADITSTLRTKIVTTQCSETEIRPWQHPLSVQGIEHLTRWRGTPVGVDAAEAFVRGRYRT